MEYQFFKEQLADTNFKFRLSMGANAVLAVFLTAMCAYSIWVTQQTRTIIVPSHLTSKFEFQGERASPEYIRVMSLHMAGLLYSYTPHRMADQYKEFLSYVPAEKWNVIRDSLQTRIDQVAKLKISETFLAEKIDILPNSVCLIAGQTIRWVSGQEIATEKLHLKISYNIINGGYRVQEMSNLNSAEYNAILRDSKK